jgi:hypothetical protein
MGTRERTSGRHSDVPCGRRSRLTAAQLPSNLFSFVSQHDPHGEPRRHFLKGSTTSQTSISGARKSSLAGAAQVLSRCIPSSRPQRMPPHLTHRVESQYKVTTRTSRSDCKYELKDNICSRRRLAKHCAPCSIAANSSSPQAFSTG